jgi:hypothetical protein
VSENELMPLPEIAVACGVRWGRAYSLLTEGKFGKPVQRDGRWFAPRKAVRAYVERQREKAASA